MRHVAWWLLRLGLAGVFIYAGMMKLGDPAGFAQEIAGYRLVPDMVGDVMAVYLPWLEVMVGLGVLLPWTVRGAAAIQAGLMGVFIVALSLAWGRGLDITCGCFGGEAEAVNYPWLIGRDLLFLVGSSLVLLAIKSSVRNGESARDRITSENASLGFRNFYKLFIRIDL